MPYKTTNKCNIIIVICNVTTDNYMRNLKTTKQKEEMPKLFQILLQNYYKVTWQ